MNDHIIIDGKKYDISFNARKLVKKYAAVIRNTINVEKYCDEYIFATPKKNKCHVIFNKIKYNNIIIEGLILEISPAFFNVEYYISINQLPIESRCFHAEYYDDNSQYLLLTTDNYKEYLKWKLQL